MVVLLAQLVIIPGTILLALYAGRDMRSRGMDVTKYALLVLFFLPVGLWIWLTDRARVPRVS